MTFGSECCNRCPILSLSGLSLFHSDLKLCLMIVIAFFPPRRQAEQWRNTPIQENDTAYGPHSDNHQTCKRVSSLHEPLPRMPPKRSTNRSCSLDEARGQGVLLNVSVQKNSAGSPPASSATPPPINGKEVSPVLEMQKLRIPAVCLPGVIT